MLQIFFGLALFFCNMCLLAVYVFRRWDKIPSDINLWEIKLIRLQKGCRNFLATAAGFLVFAALLSLVDGRLRAANLEIVNLIQLFCIHGGIP